MPRSNANRRHVATAAPGNGRAERRRTRGQALVELALIVPVLLTLFLATIDLGRFYYSQITVTNAAREAAIEAAANPTSYTSGTCNASSRVVCAAVNEARGSFVTVAPADVDLTCPGGCAKTFGKQAIVTVTGHFSLLTPLMSVFTGGSNVDDRVHRDRQCHHRAQLAGATPTPTPTATPAPTADTGRRRPHPRRRPDTRADSDLRRCHTPASPLPNRTRPSPSSSPARPPRRVGSVQSRTGDGSTEIPQPTPATCPLPVTNMPCRATPTR